MPASAFVSVREAAELIGVCRETVRLEIKAGRLIARQKGSKWLVLRESVDEWIALETDEARRAQERACGMSYLRGSTTRATVKGGRGHAAGLAAVAIFKGGAS